VLLALSACALPALATAGPQAPPGIQYALAAWSTEQAGDVLALAQDLDGYLWLGTQAGLVRFDGTRFQPWAQNSSSALPALPVPALANSSQGGVWVAFNSGGGVARIERGSITHYSPDGARRRQRARRSSRHAVAATGGGLFPRRHWSRDRRRRLRRRAGVQRLRGPPGACGSAPRAALSRRGTGCASSTGRDYVDSLVRRCGQRAGLSARGS
jgi:hypothetical protein